MTYADASFLCCCCCGLCELLNCEYCPLSFTFLRAVWQFIILHQIHWSEEDLKEINSACHCDVQDVLGEVSVNDVEVIPDVTCNADWFAHKVLIALSVTLSVH